jgi:hypothetical protein
LPKQASPFYGSWAGGRRELDLGFRLGSSWPGRRADSLRRPAGNFLSFSFPSLCVCVGHTLLRARLKRGHFRGRGEFEMARQVVFQPGSYRGSFEENEAARSTLFGW